MLITVLCKYFKLCLIVPQLSREPINIEHNLEKLSRYVSIKNTAFRLMFLDKKCLQKDLADFINQTCTLDAPPDFQTLQWPYNLKLRSCMDFNKQELYHYLLKFDKKIYISDALGVMLPSTAHPKAKDLFKGKKISKTIKKINKALGPNHLFTSLAW